MNRRSLVPALVALSLAAAFSVTFGTTALAHGEKGQRTIFTYDLQPEVQRPVDLFRLSDEYGNQLLAMGEKGENECISVAYLPARFSWDQNQLVTNPGAAGQSVGVSDYLITGRFFAAQLGDSRLDTIELSLVTTRSRTLVAKGSGRIYYDNGMDRTAAELWGARGAALDLAGNERGTEHLADKILKYEQKVREEKTETAIAPKLELEGYANTMKPGASQKIIVRLEDCDGYRLKGRKVEVTADQGSVRPEQVTIGEDGTAEVTYTAPGKRSEVSLSAVFQYERPSEKSDVAMTGGWIDVKDDKPEDPAIFHLSLEVEQEVETSLSTDPGIPLFQQAIHWMQAVEPLKLEVDVNQRMEPIPETLKAEWSWRDTFTQTTVPVAGKEQGSQTGTDFERWEVSLARHLKPVKSEPKLEVIDDELAKSLAPLLGSVQTDQPLDTLRVRYEVVLEGKTEGHFTILDQRVDTSGPRLPSFQDNRTFTYRYEQPTNEEELNELPSLPPTPLLTVKKDRIRYKMTLKDVKFDFVPGEGMTVKVAGEDYTDKFKYVQFWREWRANTKYTTLGAPRSGPYRLTQGWTEGSDELGSEMLAPLAWIVDVKTVPGDQWPAVRVLREYLIAVEGFPEFGYMYAVVIAETEPTNHYHVRKYKPEKIAASDWEKIKQSGQPYRDEDSGGEPVREFRN